MDSGPREGRKRSRPGSSRRIRPPRGSKSRWSRRCGLRSSVGGERLEPVGDDFDGASIAAVGGLPLAALESHTTYSLGESCLS